jgi:hypothetical protein
MKYFLLIVILFVILFSVPALSQSPGGVGVSDGLSVWLRADAGTASTVDGSATGNWIDQSGNSNDYTVVGTPTIETQELNFNPSIQIIGNTGFNAPLGAALSVQNSLIFVSKKIASDVNGRLFTSNTDNYLWGYHDVHRNSIFISGSPAEFNTGIAVVEGVTDFHLFSYLQSGTSSLEARADGHSLKTFTGLIRPSTGVRVDINQGNFSGSQRSDSQVGEFITYDTALSILQRQKVESYLALKYGFTLNQGVVSNYIATNNVVYWTGDVAYQYNVFGIGKDDDTALHQKVSKSVNSGSIITLATSSDFTSANLDMARSDIPTTRVFFMIGDNNGNTSLSATVLNSISPNLLRINRVWKTQDTGGLSCINYRFNTSSFSASATQDWYVVIADNDTFTTDVEIHSITVGGNVDLSMDLDNDTSNFITLARLDRDDVAVSDTGGVVGINTDDPADNTYLDIRGGNKGLVITRLHQTAIDGLTTVEGMFVFNTTTNVFQLYDGTSWRALGTPSNSKFCD